MSMRFECSPGYYAWIWNRAGMPYRARLVVSNCRHCRGGVFTFHRFCGWDDGDFDPAYLANTPVAIPSESVNVEPTVATTADLRDKLARCRMR